MKYTESIKGKEIFGLYTFMEKFKVDKGMVLTKQLEKKEKEISYVPLWKWLLGKNKESF